MTTGLILLAVGVFFFVVSLLLFRKAKRDDYALGRQAFKDGLRYNPAWGKNIGEGWLQALRGSKRG